MFWLTLQKCLTFPLLQSSSLYRQQQQLIEQWRDSQLNQFQNSYGHPAYQSGGVGASSSATYGSSGVHQTASLYPENPVFFYCHHISVNMCMLIFARVILLPKGQAQLGLSFRWWSSSCTKRRQLLWHWHIVIFPIGECGRKRDAQAWRYHNCQRQWQSDHLSTWRLGCDVQFYHFFFHSFCKFAVI